MPWFEYLLKKADLFYAPSFFEVNMGLKIPQVVTIYDLTTFIYPGHRGERVSEKLNLRTKKACKKARKIVAISKSTKKDLIKVLKIKNEKIKVVYPGKNELPKSFSKLPKNLKKRSYILSVGTIEPRKNLIGLFKAYALLPIEIQEQYPLVVVGAEGWNTGDIFESFEHLKLQGKVKFLGFVSDEKLATLYNYASLFVYPSLYEGFGFPVLEALSFGLPVITSKSSSLPEVTGHAAFLIDPNKPESISSAIQKVLEHKEEGDRLRKAAVIQAEKFSWENSAKETLKVFKEVYKKK